MCGMLTGMESKLDKDAKIIVASEGTMKPSQNLRKVDSQGGSNPSICVVSFCISFPSGFVPP